MKMSKNENELNQKAMSLLVSIIQKKRVYRIRELANSTKMSWNTAKKYIEHFKKEGLVEEGYDQKAKTKYILPNSVLLKEIMDHKETMKILPKLLEEEQNKYDEYKKKHRAGSNNSL
jgi:transposase